MERLRKSFRNSFRRKKSTHQPESIKPRQWEADEIAVRNGNCSFPVKYLGCIEVEDSRGMHICDQALINLKIRRNRIKGLLYVSGDGLRVVDDETKGLIVDQTIEKVSFCAPDRNHDRGFSYICRDGTTRRWMCHGFLATKDSGERLSHSVGCAFTVCLERKQKRDSKLNEIKALANASSNNQNTNSTNNTNSTLDNYTTNNNKTFNRVGSFRRMPIVQRMKDPQECKTIEPLPIKPVHNPYAIERPHATPQLLERQGSFRIFKGLNQNSPFKRQLSLRITSANVLEKQQRKNSLQSQDQNNFGKFDAFNLKDQNNLNKINSQKNEEDFSAICKNITESLGMLSKKEELFDDSFTTLKSDDLNSVRSGSSCSNMISQKLINNHSSPTSQYINNNSKSQTNLNSNKLYVKNTTQDVDKKMKFGQLISYSDDFFSSMYNEKKSNTLTKDEVNSNKILFTNLDNFIGDNITKVNDLNSDCSPINSSTNITIKNLKNNSNTNSNKALVNNLENSSKLSLTSNTNRKSINNHGLKKENSKLRPSNEKELFDPFDAEWVSLASRHSNELNKNTNPFLQINTIKTFELKM